MKSGNSILSSYGTTIFTVMSALASEQGAINLGQGFPDEDGPLEIRQAAAQASTDLPNQYPPMMGIPALRQAVAAANKRFYGIDLDWQQSVMVTSGATEALAACLFGLIEPGDEVVLIEPLYDSYLPIVRRAGGIPKLVRMEPPTWELPRAALEEAFSDRTKLIVINSPHNPAGKVLTPEELAFLADLIDRHDAFAVCDEVYEHLVFDGHPHIPLMTLPGMEKRCLRIGSAGKTFSLTGWKVGYISADPDLLQPVAKAHQFLTFTTPPNLQHAVALGLGLDDTYFQNLASGLQAKRDFLADGLQNIGFDVLDCGGSYFLTVDFRPLGINAEDEALCFTLTEQAKVTPVPISAFYQSGGSRHFLRFCFCKREEVLADALNRLRVYFGA
ncbi:MAG: aminotransferase [Magnetospiraceae bacterium]